MKRFLFLFMAIMFFAMQGWSQDTVIVGSGNTGNYTIPIYTFYKYSYSQQIYTANEISSGITTSSTNTTPTGVIKAIAFQYISTPQTKDNVTILMGNISNSTASTWISPSSMQQVYSGSVTLDSLSYHRWVNINLDSPFQWDGTSSIVVCVINNSGNTSGFTNTFYTHSTSVCKTLNTGNNTDLYSSTQNPTNTPTTLLYRNNIRFAFGQAPTCPKPTQISYSNISSSSANVSWHENGTASQWIFEYRLTSDTSWSNAISQTVNDTSIQLSSLNSNTSYSIRVKSVCNSNDESNWKESNFLTACGSITNLPYTENFDSYGTSILFPTCWTRQANYTSYSSTYPYINTYSPSSSPNSLYFYCGSNNTYNLATTPAFNTSIQINTLMASFKLKAAYLGSNMTIGIMSDPSDLTTFDSITSITPSTDWLNYDIDFSNYTGTGNYIAFKVASETFTTSIYLDDVSIYTIPSCRRPTNISVTNITSTTADINFTSSANANTIIAYYRIQNSNNTWSNTTVFSSPANLTNLNPNSIYEYYLVTECGNGDTSSQTSIYTFRTSCSSEIVPYLEPFSTNVLNNPCWSLAKGILSTNTIFTSNSSYWTYPTTPTPIAAGEGGNIKINIWGSSFYEWIISPLIDLGQSENDVPSTTYQVECDLRLTKAYNSTTPPDPSTDDKFAIVISRDNGLTWSINNSYIWTNNSSSARNYGTFGITPTHIVIPLTDSNNVALDGTIKFGLYVESTVSGEANNRELYIDNLAVNPAPACPTVYGVNLSLASTSSINVNFATDNIVTGESWNVAYGTADSLAAFNPDNASQINVSSASELPLLITNLTPGSTVYVAVQQTCLGAWSAIKSITLPSYAASVPFTQIFDDSTNVNEWNFINAANNSSNWIIGNAFNYSLAQDSTVSGKSLYVSNNNGLTNNITPAGSNRTYATAWVQFGDSPEFKLSFDWKSIGGYYGYYAGYVMVVDPNEVLPTTSTSSYNFPTFATILYNQSAWTHSTITLDGSYANKLKKLVFCFNNYSYASGVNGTGIGTIVDNISIENVSCGTPYNLTVDSVGSTGNDAYISWSSLNNSANYLVEYKTLSSNTWSQVISNTNSYQLTGLYPSTKYNLRVKSICSSTDSSNYTSVLTFQTSCSAISVPSPVVGFELVPPSTCWSMGAGLLPTDTSSAVIVPNTYAWSTTTIEVSPGMGKSVYAYVSAYSVSKNWLITPTYDLGNGINPANLEFDAVLKSSSGTPNLTGIDDRFAVVVSTDNGLTWKNENAYIWSNDSASTRVLNNLYPAQHIIIPLVNSAGIPYTGDIKIGFYLESTVNNAANNFYLDNVKINPSVTCQRPTNINADTIYSDNVYISFTENNSASQWQYIISNDSTINSSTLSPITSSTNPIHISGLTPSTKYYYQMRSICDANNSSSWSDRLIFKTAAIPAIIPYLCTFEDTIENNNWRTLRSTASTSYPTIWMIDTLAGNGASNTGINAAYVSNDDSSYYIGGSHSYYYTSFYRDIDFGETSDNYTLKFNWKSDGYALGADAYAGLRVYLMDVENNIPTDGLPTNVEDTIGQFLYSGSAWQTVEMELNGITGIKRLCFVAYDQYFSIVNHPAIDNVSIEVSNCSRPQNLRATNTTTTSTDIQFTGNSDSYIVEYKEESSTNYSAIEMFSNPIHLDNLSSATVYNVRLRGICGSDTSLYSEKLTFTTPCSDNSVTSFPWIEGFENGISCWAQQRMAGNVVWSEANGYYYNEIYFGGSYYAMPHTDTTIAYLYSNFAKTKLISPKLDISQLGLPYLSYWFVMQKQSQNSDTLKVYYRANEDSSWTLLRTFYSSEQPSWRNDSISLPYPSSTYQIAFEAIGNAGYGVGLDDVKVYEASTCTVPSGLTANVAHNSTTISWTTGGTETTWQIKLNSNGTPIDVQNTPTYSFNNLTAGTSYTAYIRANCGSFYSPWVGITFANAVITNINTSSLNHNSTTLIASYTQGSDAIITKGFDWKLNTASNWNTQTVTDAATTFSYPLTGLAPNTMYDVRAYIMTATDTAYSSTLQFTTLAIIAPTVTTIQTTNISNNSATLNGTTAQGTESIQARGFEYKLTSTSTWTGAISVSASGTTTISANAIGLTASNQYDVRAYAQTVSGRTYGNVENFITQGLSTPPTVTTNTVTAVTQTTATLNGNIVAGTETITAQGFEWKLASASTWTSQNVTGTNPSYQLTGLTANMAYQYRAFATTATNTYYGTTQNFSTLAIVPPTVTTMQESGVTQTTATLNGNIVAGTETITAQGFEWKLASASTWTPISATLISGAITYNLTGLTANTNYEYRAFTITTSGTEYGSTQTFTTLAIVPPTVITNSPTAIAQTIATLNGTITAGSENITNQGFEWKLASETNWTFVSESMVGNAITHNLTSLIANTAYNFKAFATTASGTIYGTIQNFNTLPEGITNPTVVTNPATAIAQTVATLNGTLTAGSETITGQGFEWKLASASTWTTVSETLVGNAITHNLTGLTANTAYDFKAYATTPTGTVYGTNQNFTTLAIVPPTVVTNPANSIAQTIATLNGTLTAGSETITDQGFEWKLASGTTWTTVSEALVGNTITHNLTSLTASTQYEYRAFATTATNTYYGTTVNFSTDAIPVVLGEVTTQFVSSLLDHSATLNGTLVSTGNTVENIEIGFVYSTLVNPVIGRNDVIKEPVTYVNGMTTYNKAITGLLSETNYYYKAYITNSAGTAYGDEQPFLTSGLHDATGDKFSITMYPNPTKNTTKLVVSGVEGETDIIINDVQGKLIYKTTAKAENGKVEQTIDVNGFAKGVYYVRIQNQKTSRTQKLIVID